MSNPVCVKPAIDLESKDFQYYDKDGFELNCAEQKFYSAMNHPIQYPLLNHTCWQEPWFELEHHNLNLILDHSMFLCRCSYNGEALEQLKELKQSMPTADYLIQTRPKWGFDFALDAVSADGTLYEVLHVEYDNYDYDHFKNRMLQFDYTVRHTDWQDAAKHIWDTRESWQTLQGFEQNHWKASNLLGWSKAEYTEKSI
jgi:hypothetical protein